MGSEGGYRQRRVAIVLRMSEDRAKVWWERKLTNDGRLVGLSLEEVDDLVQ